MIIRYFRTIVPGWIYYLPRMLSEPIIRFLYWISPSGDATVEMIECELRRLSDVLDGEDVDHIDVSEDSLTW